MGFLLRYDKAGAARLAVAVVCAGLLGCAATLANSRDRSPMPGTASAEAKVATFIDRFDAGSFGPDCSAGAWPYMDAHCLRRTDGSRLDAVRVILIDRQNSAR